MKNIIALFFTLFFVVGCSTNQADLIEQTLDSTVLIFNTPPAGTDLTVKTENNASGMGTGFIIDENVIVTNNHVIAGQNKVITVVGHDHMKMYEAEVVASDKTADIAILRLKDWDDFKKRMNPKILSWGNSRNLKVGEDVWSMGNPYGLGWTVAQGIISHKSRPLGDKNRYFLQTTTAIYPGNSGGPLFDGDGNVIGVNTAIVGREGYFGMAIPAEVARKIVDDLLNYKEAKYARMGIFLKPSQDQNHIQVASIDTNSQALDAGVLPNDIIHSVRTKNSNGWIAVTTPDDLLYEMQLVSPGDTVELEIERDGVKRIVNIPAIKG